MHLAGFMGEGHPLVSVRQPSVARSNSTLALRCDFADASSSNVLRATKGSQCHRLFLAAARMMAATAMRLAATRLLRSMRAAFMGTGNELGFILAPIVLPLQWLKVGQIIRPAVTDRHDMIDFPAVAAAHVAVILPHDCPAPGVDPQNCGCAHSSCLLPDGVNDIIAEGLA